MTPSESVMAFAEEMAKGEGMVVKAVVAFDLIDNDGDRHLRWAVSKDMTVWDLNGMLAGLIEITKGNYRDDSAG